MFSRDIQWADNAIINMFARRREPKSAFAFAANLDQKDAYSYAALLNACAKASPPWPAKNRVPWELCMSRLTHKVPLCRRSTHPTTCRASTRSMRSRSFTT